MTKAQQIKKTTLIALADCLRSVKPQRNAHGASGTVGAKYQWERTIEAIADFCAAQNPQFKRAAWLDIIAGGVTAAPNGPTFTVIGYYEETGQTWAFQVQAEHADAAIRAVLDGSHVDLSLRLSRRVRKPVSFTSDIAVIGAIAGVHELEPPCDSGALAYAVDLMPEWMGE